MQPAGLGGVMIRKLSSKALDGSLCMSATCLQTRALLSLKGGASVVHGKYGQEPVRPSEIRSGSWVRYSHLKYPANNIAGMGVLNFSSSVSSESFPDLENSDSMHGQGGLPSLPSDESSLDLKKEMIRLKRQLRGNMDECVDEIDEDRLPNAAALMHPAGESNLESWNLADIDPDMVGKLGPSMTASQEGGQNSVKADAPPRSNTNPPPASAGGGGGGAASGGGGSGGGKRKPPP
eukprot:1566064-Rhodomonas_salina.1